jgi:UPF0755 protein
MRKLVLFLIMMVVIVGTGATWRLMTFVFSPAGNETQIIPVEVGDGASLSGVSLKLYDLKLINDPKLFKILGKVLGLEKKIRTGEYALSMSMTPMQIIEVLSSGKSIQYSLTFKEGINIYEIAKIIEESKLASGEEFLRLCRDKEFIKELLNEEIDSLEGYLFPETYMVTRFTKEKKLITMMVENFKENFDSISRDQKTFLNRHQHVTLASIIEKETGAPDERPMISSVFHNRLKKGMRLQSDPTIIYGMMDKNGGIEISNISKQDILEPTRYNTYRVNALPYGPIANPGLEALKATIAPAETEFLYFVSQNNGTHVFSKNYEDHNKAVKTFQLDRKMREGRSWRDLERKVGNTENTTNQ